MNPTQIIDLDRYPIDQPDGSACQALITSGRRDLDDQALYELPGFIRADGLEALQAEARALAPKAYHSDNLRTPYGWMCNAGFEPDHPRSHVFRNRSGIVLTDQFPGDGPIEALYYWDPLTEFIRRVLGYDALYTTACPHLSFTLRVEAEGGQLGWHFDTNDAVVSLLIQQPDEGGHFEYAPYVRSEDDENYAELRRVFAGESAFTRQPAMAPGTFVLFKGRRSAHRVTPVGRTARPRLIALLSYDQRPGMVQPESTVGDFKNPSSETYHGRPE